MNSHNRAAQAREESPREGRPGAIRVRAPLTLIPSSIMPISCLCARRDDLERAIAKLKALGNTFDIIVTPQRRIVRVRERPPRLPRLTVYMRALVCADGAEPGLRRRADKRGGDGMMAQETYSLQQSTGRVSAAELRKATGWDEDRTRLALVPMMECVCMYQC